MNEGEVSSFVTPELVEGTPLLTLVTPFDDIERNLCLLSVLSYYIPGAEGGGGGRYLTKFYTGRLRPEVPPLTILYTILAEKVPLLYTF